MTPALARRACRIGMAAILLASPAKAEPLTWGSLDLSIGASAVQNEFGFPFLDEVPGGFVPVPVDDGLFASLDGRVGVDWGQFGAQIDLSVGQQERARPGTPIRYAGGAKLALHLNTDLGGWTLGAFAGAGSATPSHGEPRISLTFGGIEAAHSGPRLTIFGQVGAFDADAEKAFHDVTFARLVATRAMSDRDAVTAELALWDGAQEEAFNQIQAVTWSVAYARQIGTRPMAWSVGLEGDHFRKTFDEDFGAQKSGYDEVRVSLWLTLWFGGRRGVFDTPDFARIAVAGMTLD